MQRKKIAEIFMAEEPDIPHLKQRMSELYTG